tara:strand:+ start:3905 stop:4273 length:369 start_codon:yes stop_codon:yes gene_type:complete
MPRKKENTKESTNRRGVTRKKVVSKSASGARTVVKTKTKNGVLQKKKEKQRSAILDSDGKTVGTKTYAPKKSNPKKDARKKGNQDTRNKNSANRKANRASRKQGATSSNPSTKKSGGMMKSY